MNPHKAKILPDDRPEALIIRNAHRTISLTEITEEDFKLTVMEADQRSEETITWRELCNALEQLLKDNTFRERVNESYVSKNPRFTRGRNGQ
jgi:hypothetical protein